MLEKLFELVWGPLPGTEPSGIEFSVLTMFVHGASSSDFNQVIENLNPAFLLVFRIQILMYTKAGHIISAI